MTLPPSTLPVLQVVASRSNTPGFALAPTSDGVYVLDHGPTVKRLDAALATTQDYPAPGQVLDIATTPEGVLYEVGYGGDGLGTTANAYRAYGGDPYDAFLRVVGPLPSDVSYATYLGGASGGNGRGEDKASGIAVNPNGDVYVIGVTNSEDFPDKNAYQGVRPTHTGSVGGPVAFDVFAARFTPRPP